MNRALSVPLVAPSLVRIPFGEPCGMQPLVMLGIARKVEPHLGCFDILVRFGILSERHAAHAFTQGGQFGLNGGGHAWRLRNAMTRFRCSDFTARNSFMARE